MKDQKERENEGQKEKQRRTNKSRRGGGKTEACAFAQGRKKKKKLQQLLLEPPSSAAPPMTATTTGQLPSPPSSSSSSSSPFSTVHRAGSGPVKYSKFLIFFQKICDFSHIFLLNFNQYRFVFLYYKDTNPVLKYPVFSKVLQKKKLRKRKKDVLFSCIRSNL